VRTAGFEKIRYRGVGVSVYRCIGQKPGIWNSNRRLASLRALSLSKGAAIPTFAHYHSLDTRHQILDTGFMTRNPKPETRNSSSNGCTVRLKKPHPCGSNEFTVIRDSVIVTLKCNTCGSFVRMEKGKYVKAVIGDR